LTFFFYHWQLLAGQNHLRALVKGFKKFHKNAVVGPLGGFAFFL